MATLAPPSPPLPAPPAPSAGRRLTLYRVLGAVGRTMIATGVLILLFVAYMLWGTGLHEARAQAALEDEFSAALARAGVTGEPEGWLGPRLSGTAGDPEAPTGEAGAGGIADLRSRLNAGARVLPPPPPPAGGDAVARIRIPRIGVDKIVVEGVRVSDLRKGPGHYPSTPLPGQPGNAAIAGHRTTYGAPFFRLDELEPGDLIHVTTLQGQFTYEVDGSIVVRPSDTWVLDPTPEARLTLTTCNPRYSARQRLVVTARLVGQPAPAAPAPTPEGGPAEVPADTPVTVPAGQPTPTGGEHDPGDVTGPEPAPEPDVLAEGFGGPPEEWRAAGLWALPPALIALAGWWWGRRWRRWPAWLLTAGPFLVALYAFFERFSRLMPENF